MTDNEMPTPELTRGALKLTELMLDVLAEGDMGGALQIFIEDGNIERHWMDALRANAETAAEIACIEHAAGLSDGERWAAWLMLNGRVEEAAESGVS